VGRSVNELHLRVSRIVLAQTFDSPLTAMDGTIVYDPKHAPSLIVGRPRHNLDQAIKGRNAVDRLTSPEDSGMGDIQGTQIDAGSPRL
jgi:hypothetical protein